uniref:AARP2CN domain-containing protein n=1 Tax=Amphimedon queenslandica TaxID=400682 RepID=A0A1X7T6M2_AMPQE
METFEFLNILQTHGFPRVMGVLTHLDMMKKNKNLRRLKKKLKQRFWTEIYQGAKLFYLSNIRHGQYMKNELHDLGRFISVTKFKPLDWQSSHPYLIADRMEDLTSPDSIKEDPLCNRTISLYGYVRGTSMKSSSYVHIPGCGDFKMADLSVLPDPYPLPEKEKKRSLDERETHLCSNGWHRRCGL